MPIIKNYITQDDGRTTVVIKGVKLDNKTTLLLDNGYEVEADVRVVDPFKITDKQRRKIFALCNDIEAYTGQPRDYMRLFVHGLRRSPLRLRETSLIE